MSSECRFVCLCVYMCDVCECMSVTFNRHLALYKSEIPISSCCICYFIDKTLFRGMWMFVLFHCLKVFVFVSATAVIIAVGAVLCYMLLGVRFDSLEWNGICTWLIGCVLLLDFLHFHVLKHKTALIMWFTSMSMLAPAAVVCLRISLIHFVAEVVLIYLQQVQLPQRERERAPSLINHTLPKTRV